MNVDGHINRVSMRWGACTHPGHRRDGNEDAILAAPGVFVVADGMGGPEGGASASTLTRDVFATAVDDAAAGTLTLDATRRLVIAANEAIREEARESGRPGMGTTLVAMVVALNGCTPTPVVLNIGDSRCYALRAGALRRITHDHSHVQELIDDGALGEDDARRHPLRNVITRALGTGEAVEPDYVVLDDADVRILLCSDGVSTQLTDDEIARALAAGTPQDAAERLVELVLAGPAPDNASAVVVDVAVTAAGDGDETDRREARPAVADPIGGAR